MSNVVISDSSKFEAIVNNLEKSVQRINDVFTDENNNIEQINNTKCWSGKTEETVYGKYRELTNNYEPIKEALTNYVKFLKITLENYKQYEAMLDRQLEENSENMNVN